MIRPIIYQGKLPYKDSSVWYDGTVMKWGNILVTAVGETRIYDKKGELVFDRQGRSYFDEDKINTDRKLINAIDKHGWNVDANNWFEIMYPDRDGKMISDIAHDYTEAMQIVKKLVKEYPYLTTLDTPAKQYAHEMEKYIAYIFKHTHTNLWLNMRTMFMYKPMDENIVNFSLQPFKSREECIEHAEEFGLVKIYKYKTTTLTSHHVPKEYIQGLKRYIEEKEALDFFWQGKYNYIVSLKNENNDYHGFLYIECKKKPVRHIYKLLDENHAIFFKDEAISYKQGDKNNERKK